MPYSIAIATNSRAILTDFRLVANSIAIVTQRQVLLSEAAGTSLVVVSNRRVVLTDLINPVGFSLVVATNRTAILTDLNLVGYSIVIGSSKAQLTHQVPNGLVGISLVLSDRQIITQRVGLQGVSLVLSDRQIITQRVGIQGVSLILSDQQPFAFTYGLNAVSIEGVTDEQWFEPTQGMKAVDIELDYVTPRGFIIKK